MPSQLRLSDNSKVKFKKNHLNTFGLSYGRPEDGGTCPGSTCGPGGCLDTRQGKRQTCYVAKIVQIYKATGKVLADNTLLVVDKKLEEMVEIIRGTINQFVKKTPVDQLYFRLHWAGDFFSEDYAQAWATVIKEFPNVRFWVYTRSFNFISSLLGINNLTLFLSCDPTNFDEVYEVYKKYKDENTNLAMAFMGNECPEPAKFRWVKCPEISGKVVNTPDAGACSKCRLCVDNYKTRVKNIQFPIH